MVTKTVIFCKGRFKIYFFYFTGRFLTNHFLRGRGGFGMIISMNHVHKMRNGRVPI